MLSRQQISDLQKANRVKYVKDWNGSRRKEYLDRIEWYTQVRDQSGCTMYEIDLVVFNNINPIGPVIMPSNGQFGGDCQLPSAKYYVEIA
jgi:hypothetical protein